ncbi:MAG: TRAP transporter small permease subunit [Pseudomonadota bacterium]
MVGRVLEQFCLVLRVLLGVLMGALAIPVAMQVISRYTGLIPTFLWTEELATFIFVWIVMIGSAVAVWDGTHFDVRVTRDASSPLARLLQNGFVYALIMLFALLFVVYGVDYVEFGNNQRSVMMRANLALIYVSVPMAGTVWLLLAGYRLAEEISAFRKRSATS